MTDLTKREAAAAAKEAIEQLCEIAETTANDLKAAQVECVNLHNKWTSAQSDVAFWKYEGTRVQQKLDDVTRQNEEIRGERDAMREHIKNLEAEVSGLRQVLTLWHAVDRADQEGKPYRITRTRDGVARGVAVDDGKERTLTQAPVNTPKAPDISPEDAKKAVQETFGDTLYEAFLRGVRHDIIGELQAKDEERFPR